jgi:hypothetical protein
VFKSNPLDAPQQGARLGYVYGDNVRRVRHGAWEMKIQPTDMSSCYRVRIEYDPTKGPSVLVVDPPLRRRDGDSTPIPHTYDEATSPRPCLYYPGEWTRSTSTVARSFVPWIAEWLYFYEVWLATGKWLGGGVEHGGEKVT